VKGEEILCTSCLVSLPRTDYLNVIDNPISEKFIGRIPLKNAWAFLRFRKTGIVQHLLHQLKYNNHPEIGIRLGRLFGKDMIEKGRGSDFDLIVPLPLYASRERSRGYNQSAKFADGLSESLKIPSEINVCMRQKNTETQTRRTKSERWENVDDAFVIVNEAVIYQKRVLLVDDVITTGATIEACGRQLFKAGCSELGVACIAEAQ
jgi:ComF family protein